MNNNLNYNLVAYNVNLEESAEKTNNTLNYNAKMSQ